MNKKLGSAKKEPMGRKIPIISFGNPRTLGERMY